MLKAVLECWQGMVARDSGPGSGYIAFTQRQEGRRQEWASIPILIPTEDEKELCLPCQSWSCSRYNPLVFVRT